MRLTTCCFCFAWYSRGGKVGRRFQIGWNSARTKHEQLVQAQNKLRHRELQFVEVEAQGQGLRNDQPRSRNSSMAPGRSFLD